MKIKKSLIFILATITILILPLKFSSALSKNDGWYYQKPNPIPQFGGNSIELGPFTSFQICTDVSGQNSGGNCYEKVESPVDVSSQKNTSSNNTYKLLAPIGGQKEVQTTDIGTYFNWIFKLAIAICAGLAVIMIVIGGVQWMGDESVFGKTEAKSKITGAVLGLLIALGAYALLNTIDPALTGSGGLNIKQVTANIEGEDTGVFGIDGTDAIPTGNIGDCKANSNSKIIEISPNGKNMLICNDIATKVNLLILNAKDKGIILSGGSFRSKSAQEKLRIKNCGDGNTYNENANCNPPTAIPGTSMHESGLAVDFKCDGQIINITKRTQTKKCFDWLNTNAKNYGLINLASENWHWSTNGK